MRFGAIANSVRDRVNRQQVLDRLELLDLFAALLDLIYSMIHSTLVTESTARNTFCQRRCDESFIRLIFLKICLQCPLLRKATPLTMSHMTPSPPEITIYLVGGGEGQF